MNDIPKPADIKQLLVLQSLQTYWANCDDIDEFIHCLATGMMLKNMGVLAVVSATLAKMSKGTEMELIKIMVGDKTGLIFTQNFPCTPEGVADILRQAQDQIAASKTVSEKN